MNLNSLAIILCLFLNDFSDFRENSTDIGILFGANENTSRKPNDFPFLRKT